MYHKVKFPESEGFFFFNIFFGGKEPLELWRGLRHWYTQLLQRQSWNFNGTFRRPECDLNLSPMAWLLQLFWPSPHSSFSPCCYASAFGPNMAATFQAFCVTGWLKLLYWASQNTIFHSVAVLSRVGQTWQPFFRLFVWSILDSLGDWSFSGNWQPSTLYPSYCLTWHLPPILPYGTFASFAWPNRHGVWLVFLCSVDVPRTQYWLMM